jgi:peroxiredoxin 2/4
VKEMDNNTCGVRIGMQAPDFQAITTFGPLKLSNWKGSWIVFFSHPGDFTPVCTTEFIEFAKAYPAFVKRNTKLLGLSIDSNPSHLAWVHNIYMNTGIAIPFPIVADRDMSIAKKYGMISPEASSTETVRSVFIIDDRQIIRAILSYPLTNGRCIPEIIRLLDALQTSDREKVVTPANWCPGQPVMVPPPKTYEELLEREGDPEGLRCIDWYWCYRDKV